MSSIRELLDKTDLSSEITVTVEGWVRTSRFAKRVTFIHLYDGSTEQTIQVVVSPAVSAELKARLGVGASVRVEGSLVPSPGPEQPSEVKTTEEQITVVGDCDPAEFPIQKKEATPEFFRSIPHLRPRAAEYQRIFIARNRLSRSFHDFFQHREFMWVHTPIITHSDCEGAGEMFHVATDAELRSDEVTILGGMQQGIRGLSDRAFFGRPSFLTVSGQLEVEAFATAFSKVYTFGPTFRAENSHTSRHASEFWMVEPEIAFATLDDVVDLAEDFIKYIAGHQFDDREEGPAIPKEFARVTYTEAMEILAASGREFEHPIGWGESLQAEHERYLAEEHFSGPVFVTHYPIRQKPFYMRVADYCAHCMGEGHVPAKLPPSTSALETFDRCPHCDGSGEAQPGRQTVECFDLLVPGVGEIIGGSAREERLDKLLWQMERCEIDMAEYDWYADLRRYGTVPHGGFGLGLERALMWLLDVSNIRDVLPYPRTPR